MGSVTTSLSHTRLCELLEARNDGQKRRTGIFVHAFVLANFREPNISDMYMEDGRMRVLTPDCSEFGRFAKAIPDIIMAIAAWGQSSWLKTVGF